MVLALATLAGCAVLQPVGTLGDAGYSTVAVSITASAGTTTMRVGATGPPGVPPEAAVEQAERLLWHTQPTRFDRLLVVIDGVESPSTREQLTERYGPRDPSLDVPPSDPALILSVVGAVCLLIAAVVVAVVVLVPRRRRRRRAALAHPDPLEEGTDLIGRRVAQFAIDYIVWYVPSVVPMVLAVFLPTFLPTRSTDGDLRLWVFFGAGGASFALAIAWGWFTYAWWPARHGGQTFGMRRLGLRVITTSGTPAGLGAHTGRWVLLFVDVGLNAVVALMAMALSAYHQRIGDMATGTVVVRVDVEPPARTTAPPAFGAGAEQGEGSRPTG